VIRSKSKSKERLPGWARRKQKIEGEREDKKVKKKVPGGENRKEEGLREEDEAAVECKNKIL
jgi:hypothetical protein